MQLARVVRIEELLAADASTPLGALMDADPPVVSPGADEEVAAWKAVRPGESALAMIDGEGRFAGLVPPRRIVEVLLAEHDENLARLGAYLASTSSARHAVEEPVLPRVGHRLPWLLVGLVGALASAGVVAAEEQLDREVLLASFVPGIVYMAGAVGTQTVALVVRGLSVGVSIGRVTVIQDLLSPSLGRAATRTLHP